MKFTFFDLFRLEHQQMRAVRERRPERLDAQADLELVARAAHDIGHHVHAFVERDEADRERLMALERRARAIGDREGEDLALARNLAPFEVAMAVVDARRAREELVLAAALVELEEQSLLACGVPIGFGERARLGRLAGDVQRVVEASHCRVSRIRGQDHYDAAAPVAAVGNAADPGDQRVPGVFHLPLAAFAEELAYRLDHIGAASGQPALAGRNLPATGIERQVARMGEVVLVDESATLPALAEAQHLELHHDGDDEIVIGMERCDVLGTEAGLRECPLTRDIMAALGDIDDRLAGAVIGALAIADRHHDLRAPFLLGALAAGDQEPARSVADHHAVQQTNGLGDHARIEIVVYGDRFAQLLHRELVEQGVAALRHGKLAERGVVEPELVLVAPAEQAERRRRADIAERHGPFVVERAHALVVLGGLGVGEQAHHGRAQAGIDRCCRARDCAEWRAAADIDGLAEIDLERELVGGGLRPEAVACAGHRRGQNEAVDLAFFESGLVEERLEDFGPEFPHVPIAFFNGFRFGVADDRRITQCHAGAPAALLSFQRPSPEVPGAASGAARFSTNAVTRSKPSWLATDAPIRPSMKRPSSWAMSLTRGRQAHTAQLVSGAFCAIRAASAVARASDSPLGTRYWQRFARSPSAAVSTRPVSMRSAMRA